MGRVALDGEVVCLADDGRPNFRALLHRHAGPGFYSVDLLSLGGKDFRDRPLVERKRVLRRLIPGRLGTAPLRGPRVGDGVGRVRS